jgi:hypothetical protein
VALAAKHNTAIVLDTDSVFHGVDRVAETTTALPALAPGMVLTWDDRDKAWFVSDAGRELARYRWNELRFSVSWKAYCYADAAEQALVDGGGDELDRATLLDTLEQDLRSRGRLTGSRPDDTAFALQIIEEYIRFPPPAPAAAAP